MKITKRQLQEYVRKETKKQLAENKVVDVGLSDPESMKGRSQEVIYDMLDAIRNHSGEDETTLLYNLVDWLDEKETLKALRDLASDYNIYFK